MYDIFWYSTDLELSKQQAIANCKTEFAWILCDAVDYRNFNLRWVPNRHEQKQYHVWGSHNNPNSHTTWLLPINHIKTAIVNYHSEVLPSKGMLPTWTWNTDSRIDYSNFNFDWLPDSWEWDKNHAWAMHGTTQLAYTYLIRESATETVYHLSDLKFLPGAADNEWQWITDNRIDYSNFNFDWLPDAWDKDLEHRFAIYGCEKLSYTSLANKNCEIKGFKYHTSTLMFKEPIVKITKEELTRIDLPEWVWVIDNRIDYKDFNFTWLPDEWDINKIHCFCMNGCENLHYTNLVNTNYKNSTFRKYHKANLKFKPGAADDEWVWVTDDRIDYSNFNFDWLPDSWDINKEHNFCMRYADHLSYTKLYNAKHVTSAKKYHGTKLKFLPGAADDEWIWVIDPRIDYSDFDFNWLPNGWDIDKEHCFTMKGCEQLHYTKLYNKKHNTGTKKYHQVGLTFIEGAAANEWVWDTDDRIDYSNFDFNWLPDEWDTNKTHYFCMEDTKQLSYTCLRNIKVKSTKDVYHVSHLNFKEEPRTLFWPDYITHEQQYEWLCSQYISDEWIWVCDSRINYDNLNKRWLPDAWDIDKIHCLTMRNQKQLSYTWLVNTKTLHNKDFKYYKSSLKFEKSIQDKVYWPDFVTEVLSGFDWQDSLANWVIAQELENEWVWIVDSRVDYDDFDFTWLPDVWDNQFIHCFAMKGKEQLSYTWLVNTKTVMQKKFKYHTSDLLFNDKISDLIFLDMGFGNTSGFTADKTIRFIGNMESVLRTAIKRATSEWLWVCSTCSDYGNFKFNWIPDLDQLDFTHCWPTVKQIKGETFLIHVPTFLRTNEFRWNFEHEIVTRHTWPHIVYFDDNLADAINRNQRGPAVYTLYLKNGIHIRYLPTPCLWEDRPVVSLNSCNSASLVPRDCIVKKEIYEYPYLDRDVECATTIDMDVVFISNGEKDSKINGNRCHFIAPNDLTVHTSENVNGRLKAYQAAAEQSRSDWFLAVFAKCYMLDSFHDFKWRPDYWQQPKHYIFHNYNFDLGLTYGHMAPIAYNKRLMLNNPGGLDMTLAQEHAVVPIVLSETRLDDPWDTWRTAFRETVKLLYYSKTGESLELRYRLDTWLNGEVVWTKENTWYKRGAQDAVTYFESTDGDLAWIHVTSEWDWLRKRFDAIQQT